MSDRPADRPVPPLARASARRRAYTDNGTNDGTSTERRISAQQPAITTRSGKAIREVGAEDALSNYQRGINLRGWHAVCAKASEGTGYTDPSFGTFRTHAAGAGAFFFGYHFLHAGNGAGQADHYFGAAGRTPCMIDLEPTSGSNPSLADAEHFCDRLRAHGCACNMLYLPRWYWGNMGQPALGGLAQRHLHLVSSAYTAYNDHGPGWAPYGGMVPLTRSPARHWRCGRDRSRAGERAGLGLRGCRRRGGRADSGGQQGL